MDPQGRPTSVRVNPSFDEGLILGWYIEIYTICLFSSQIKN